MLNSRRLFAWAVLAAKILGALSAPGVNSQSTNVVSRADSADKEFVVTPAGPVLKSQVYAVPPNARVEQKGNSIHVIAANGTTLRTAPLTSLNRAPIERRNLQSGYVALAYTYQFDSSPVSTFTTSWTVPQVPESVVGQTIFIFNGLEPFNGDSILQPVLQFGPSASGGGNYWAVSSWWVTGSGTFFTPPVPVSVNQVLTGVMTLESITNAGGVTSYSYNSVFTGIPGSSLSISSTRELLLAFEALEIYNAQTLTNVPRGRTSMSAIDIVKQDGTRPRSAFWLTSNPSVDGFSVSVIEDGLPNGQVDILYPLQ